jgi:hypothetical protein
MVPPRGLLHLRLAEPQSWLMVCLRFCAGHYFIYMDKLFGSLVTPTEYAAAMAKPGSALKAA